MKKLMLIAAMMVASVCANAQMFVKPMVGGTLATVTDNDEGKFKPGIVAGGEFGYFIADNFAVTAGALVSMQGTSIKDTDDTKDYSTTLTYLNIPLLANFYIIPGLAVKAGIQPGYMLSAKTKNKVFEDGKWEEYDHSGTDAYEKLDISIPLGASYEFGDFVIDARYNLGLTKIFDAEHAKSKNSVIMLTLGYKIPL